MRQILLVEPDYRSKFPPLGLMRLSSYHKSRSDRVVFTRGKNPELRNVHWDRIYVASLFTWELPRTVETVRYYQHSVASSADIVVGGIGATLHPTYIKSEVDCTVVEGMLDQAGQLDTLAPPVSKHPLDYSILDTVPYNYQPLDAYFCKITIGCIRKCSFCAVPILEPRFGMATSLAQQVKQIQETSGDKQHLVVLDNNILGIDGLDAVFDQIRSLGFGTGARRSGRLRKVDFNQGLDARLITKEKAGLLASVATSPMRLAYDHVGMEKSYRRAVELLADVGMRTFTNYLLFNFEDEPADLYHRLQVNRELTESLGVAITGFPMRFMPMDDISRRHVGPKWTWRYLRGMQCVLLATHGVISPNPEFLDTAFGNTLDGFLEILAMPDRYILWRNAYRVNGADDWRSRWRSLGASQRREFLDVLERLHKSKDRQSEIGRSAVFRDLIEHYYPGGLSPHNGPPEEDLGYQGLSTALEGPPDSEEGLANRMRARRKAEARPHA